MGKVWKATSATRRQRLAALAFALSLTVAADLSPAEEAGPGPAAPSDPAVAASEPAPVAPASPGEEPGGGARSPIVVEADSLEVDKETKCLNAQGNVVVEWDTTRLGAGSLRINERERTVEGDGGVSYESDELIGKASSVHLDVDDETGTLDDVDLRLKDETGRFGGERIEKLEGRHLILQDGYFTTCDVNLGHAPDWELRGDKLDLRLDDYARLSKGRLEIRGVPVLYVPYLVFPTKQTRQSGLLAPSFGSSNRRGFLYDQPWFWDIDKQHDLTLTGVVETSARIGVDSEYRYAPSHRRAGRLDAAYYNEAVRGDAEDQIDSPLFDGSHVPLNRGAVEGFHRERLDLLTAYADLQVVSDDLYLREVDSFEGDATERELRRSRRYTTSRVGFVTDSNTTSAGMELIGYQSLVDSQKTTLQKPLGAWLRSDRNLGPFVLGVDSSLATFARQKGADGERVDVATTLGVPLVVSDRLTSKAWVRGRGTAYAMNEQVLTGDGTYQRFDEFPTRGVFEGGVDARTKVSRDYALEAEHWSAVYHSLEPFVAFHYLSEDNSEALPLFDGLDAIDGRDTATLGVDSRFLLRRRDGHESDAGPFELGRVSLSQSYNVTQKVVDDHFSDIDLAAFIQPIKGFAVRTLTSYNVGAQEVRGAHASVSWDAGPLWLLRGPKNQVAAAFRYVRSDTADILESTELLARLGLTPRISLGLKGRYDVISSRFVEEAGGLTFSSACNCWSIGVGVIKSVNPDEFQVRVNFELSGLGGFGSGATSRTSPALDDVSYQDLGFWRAGW